MDAQCGGELPALYYFAVGPQLHVAVFGAVQYLVARAVRADVDGADLCLARVEYGDAGRVALEAVGGEGVGMLVASRIDVDVAVHEVGGLGVHADVVHQNVLTHGPFLLSFEICL